MPLHVPHPNNQCQCKQLILQLFTYLQLKKTVPCASALAAKTVATKVKNSSKKANAKSFSPFFHGDLVINYVVSNKSFKSFFNKCFPFPIQVVSDHQGNLRITVRKTKPLLGIAIEGGANTRHPLPRIINIHENGAAFDAGGLEVGQLILEVDGNKVEGMQHQEVARLIAESFAARDRTEIEFLVVEAKKSNLEPKPTALIFLEA
ncbi:uncharacterized protein LOC120350726 [Nilaparvata lugens]|uniref:uncharacterized protein LOC120350726 n=1 Tax=Nilaparvata lugens TaxID=108931 RepID=UPI00193D5212|nr:uncharacterized protein LOC120350726 [Nilaparvata lugens]